MRTRLYEILERGFASKLTLVAAPAGYGKTTLVSEWVLGKDLPTAWFTVDERDNDPARFLIHLIAALQTVNQNIGADALEVLYSPVQMRIEAILSLLINDLATSGSPLILVLDDYHLLEHTKLHEAM
ncbi:MAG TPA: LuxR family transcriptional regulator, partial [Anaerolineae bacterium]|nr:LuxR family transcriptional regulator [Anaerolineae bacterium]